MACANSQPATLFGLHLLQELLEALRDDPGVRVELLAPLQVLVELVPQPEVGLLPLEDEIVEVLVAELLAGAALARALPTPLELGLHVCLEIPLARFAAALALD